MCESKNKQTKEEIDKANVCFTQSNIDDCLFTFIFNQLGIVFFLAN